MFDAMNVIEGGFFDQLRRMEREMDLLSGVGMRPGGLRDMARGAYPPINVGANSDQVDVYLFAAGLNPKAVDISIQHNLLIVAGERRPMLEEGADYYRKERFDGDFRRVVTLPDDVDADQVEAVYRHGVLHITLKRREALKPRQIEIK